MSDAKEKQKNNKEMMKKKNASASSSLEKEHHDDDWPLTRDKGNATASPFTVFATMYAASFLLELMEKWHNPAATAIFVAFFILLQVTGVRLSVYLAFIASATLYELMYCFPDVANHTNLAIFVNILQLAVAMHTTTTLEARRRRSSSNNINNKGGSTTDDDHHRARQRQQQHDFFTTLRPVLGVAVVFMYFFAGFHKLNHDFFNPTVSCTNRFLKKIMAFYKITGGGGGRTIMEPNATVVMCMSVVTVAWEVGGAVCLLWTRTQPYMLLYSCMMHLILAPCSFYDFASMVFALFAVFMPTSYWKLYQVEAYVTLPVLGGLKVSRPSLYAASTLMIGAYTWIYQPQTPMQVGDVQFKAGQMYCASFFVLAWPIVRRLMTGSLPQWQSSFRSWTAIRPRWAVIPIYALLVVFAMSNYLGLRTAGTFSMFSNLKTEGARSNHLLLGSNPIKFWHYQEDVVYIQEAVVYQNTIENRQALLKNVAFPLIEFQKKLYEWQRDSPYPIYAYFDFREQCFESMDLAHDARWLVPLDWRHYFMDFRMIQMDDEPNRCVW